VAARYGGEEFVLILPETDLDNAKVVAEKIRGFVEQMEIAHGRETIRVTISAGVAAFPRHAGDKQSLIRSADGALYIAKRGGKNLVCVAERIVPR
jgi:diguanylate cyclase (GGDEF)-like protein